MNVGWMQAWESYIAPEDYEWSGMMTFTNAFFFTEGETDLWVESINFLDFLDQFIKNRYYWKIYTAKKS